MLVQVKVVLAKKKDTHRAMTKLCLAAAVPARRQRRLLSTPRAAPVSGGWPTTPK